MAAGLVARIDPMTAFESFGGIFDQIAADGDKGTYKELIDDLRDNPKGPRVDLRKEIVGQLGEVVTLLSDCQQPLGPTSERAAAVFTVKDERVVAAAIRRAVEDDPKVKRTDVGGRTVWEIVLGSGADEAGGSRPAAAAERGPLCAGREALHRHPGRLVGEVAPAQWPAACLQERLPARVPAIRTPRRWFRLRPAVCPAGRRPAAHL